MIWKTILTIILDAKFHDARSTRAEPFDYLGAGKAWLAAAIEAGDDGALGATAKAIGNTNRNELGDTASVDR